MKKNYDICVVGNWACINYGAHLTQYALYRYLCDCGYSVLMVEKTDCEPQLPNTPSLFIDNPYTIDDLCQFYPNLHSMKELNNIANTFIVGSDQLWVWKLFWYAMDVYSLSFVNENKRKISYATSFGNRWTECTERQRVFLSKMLKRFQRVSVREKFAEEYCKELFDINARCVIDPVFLCDKKYYEEMSEKSNLNIQKPYIFCYVIWPNERIEEMIKELAEKYDLDVICIGDAYHDRLKDWRISLKKNIMVEDWLYLVRHSEWIVTDSFHAYCFSMIFKKRIIPFGTEACLDRMSSLADQSGKKKPLTFHDIYSMTNEELFAYYDEKDPGYMLDDFISRSKRWLDDALISNVEDKVDSFWDEFGTDFIEMRKDRAINNRVIMLEDRKTTKRNVVVFGTGFCYRRYFMDIESHLGIDYCCDNDSSKWGHLFNEKKCISPKELSKISNVYVIVAIDNIDSVASVKSQLKTYGITDALGVEEYLSMIRWM